MYPGPIPYHPFAYSGYPYAPPFLPPNPMPHQMYSTNFPGYPAQYVPSIGNLIIPGAPSSKSVVSTAQTLPHDDQGLFPV